LASRKRCISDSAAHAVVSFKLRFAVLGTPRFEEFGNLCAWLRNAAMFQTFGWYPLSTRIPCKPTKDGDGGGGPFRAPLPSAAVLRGGKRRLKCTDRDWPAVSSLLDSHRNQKHISATHMVGLNSLSCANVPLIRSMCVLYPGRRREISISKSSLVASRFVICPSPISPPRSVLTPSRDLE
jgi:hypothetical protein